MGAAGAALGTTLSQTISVIVSLIAIRKKQMGIQFGKKDLIPNKEMMAELLLIGTVGRVGVIFAGYMGSVPLMLAFTAIAALGMAPWQGDMGAVVASCSEYTYLTKHKHIDGTMYSCTSFGTKIGGGIGVALCGWLLDVSGFVKEAAVQPASCLNMLHIMYLWIPMVLSLIITFIMSRMNVEDANEKLKKQLEEC